MRRKEDCRGRWGCCNWGVCPRNTVFRDASCDLPCFPHRCAGSPPRDGTICGAIKYLKITTKTYMYTLRKTDNGDNAVTRTLPS